MNAEGLEKAEQITTCDSVVDLMPRLRSYVAARTPTPDLADDVVQETCLRTLKHKDLSRVTHPFAYMIKVARSVMYEHWKATPVTDVDISALEVEDERTSLEEQHLHREKLAAMAEALAKMPPLRRRVFEMRRVQGMSRQDIAAALDLNLEAIKKHINRAMVDITLHVEQQGW
ncbi:RNA polymerase sigma factor [Microbulbifer elongatus]|uniref:RNA polymerase sigma factor n=1 Tax=Microbulbifer elongatus TaxID=86173 RepID=UPI001E4C4939|nr:RNA polymerase sigma factor [Microbulbifer elongatus]